MLSVQSVQTHAVENSDFHISARVGFDIENPEPLSNGIKENLEILPQDITKIDAVDSRGFTALHRACLAKHGKYSKSQLATVKELINQGANVNGYFKFGTPLHSAVRYESGLPIALELIKAGADVNALSNIGLQPIIYLIRSPKISKKDTLTLLDAMVNAGLTVNAKSRSTLTILHFAALHRPSIIENLIELSADVNALDNTGKAAIHYISMRHDYKPVPGIQDGINALIEAGANIELLDNKMMSALAYATPDTTRLLLAVGASPNGTPSGYPPIHEASLAGKEEKVSLLIAAGADLKIKWYSKSVMDHVYKGMRRNGPYDYEDKLWEGRPYINIADALLAAGGGDSFDKIALRFGVHPLRGRDSVLTAVFYGLIYSPIVFPVVVMVISLVTVLIRRTRIGISTCIASCVALVFISAPYWMLIKGIKDGSGLEGLVSGYSATTFIAAALAVPIIFFISYRKIKITRE